MRKRSADTIHVGREYIEEVPIPFRPGRLPIRVDGPENLVALVNISAGLRIQRWIGEQKNLYVLGASAWCN